MSVEKYVIMFRTGCLWGGFAINRLLFGMKRNDEDESWIGWKESVGFLKGWAYTNDWQAISFFIDIFLLWNCVESVRKRIFKKCYALLTFNTPIMSTLFNSFLALLRSFIISNFYDLYISFVWFVGPIFGLFSEILCLWDFRSK